MSSRLKVVVFVVVGGGGGGGGGCGRFYLRGAKVP